MLPPPRVIVNSRARRSRWGQNAAGYRDGSNCDYDPADPLMNLGATKRCKDAYQGPMLWQEHRESLQGRAFRHKKKPCQESSSDATRSIE